MMKSRNEPSNDAHVKRNRDLGRGKGDEGKSTLASWRVIVILVIC